MQPEGQKAASSGTQFSREGITGEAMKAGVSVRNRPRTPDLPLKGRFITAPMAKNSESDAPHENFSLDKRLDSLYNATQYSKCNDRENVAASISESRRVL